jgi:hypothetical protein
LALYWPLVLPDTAQNNVDLRPFGFPTDPNPVAVADVKASIFFLSKDTLALYFEQRVSGSTTPSHSFKLLTFSTTGQMIAQRAFQADGKSLDVSGGPNESILLRESERLDFFDARLQSIKTHPLPIKTVGESFDRALNQLVVITIDEESGNQDARFLDANTFDELTVLVYPKRSHAIFGKKQLAYMLTGNCIGALHVQPDPESWRSLDSLQACDALTFVGSESLAYATNRDLYVVQKSGKRLFHGHIPAPDSFHLPNFVGLSDDNSRLAIMAMMKRGMFATKPGTWPYYNEIYVFDLAAQELLFKHMLTGDMLQHSLQTVTIWRLSSLAVSISFPFRNLDFQAATTAESFAGPWPPYAEKSDYRTFETRCPRH